MYVIIIQYSFFNCCEINFMCYIFTVADIFENILTAKNFTIYDIIMLLKNEYKIVYSINRRVSQI